MITTQRLTLFAYLSCGIGAILGYHLLLQFLIEGNVQAVAFWLPFLLSATAIFWYQHLRYRQLTAVVRIQTPKKPAPRKLHYMTHSSLREYQYGQYVYVIQDLDVTGMFKIGCTSHPSKRLVDFGVLLPFRVGVLMIIPADNMHRLEGMLHTRFASKRVRGEWFLLDDSDLEYLYNVRNGMRKGGDE